MGEFADLENPFPIVDPQQLTLARADSAVEVGITLGQHTSDDARKTSAAQSEAWSAFPASFAVHWFFRACCRPDCSSGSSHCEVDTAGICHSHSKPDFPQEAEHVLKPKPEGEPKKSSHQESP